MQEEILKLTIGGLLHDVGKVLYRGDDQRNHSQSGYDFLKDTIGLTDRDILDQVRYHHAKFLSRADVADSSLAYITYVADNIAAAADRRENDSSDTGFSRTAALESIFNILNGSHGNMKYKAAVLDDRNGIQFPQSEGTQFDEEFYIHLKQELKDVLAQVVSHNEIRQEYINSLLEVMEAELSFVPSSTNRQEIADISLFDHVKMTAAIGCCVYSYLKEQGVTDYRASLFTNGKAFYDKQAFLLLSIDMSGIQSFIYKQYDTDDVLKNLRARSFYLDVMMENLVDELLNLCGLPRTQLIYSGGGHAYLLLPATETVMENIRKFKSITGQWMLQTFKTDLYAALGYTMCSANDLLNKPEGRYQAIYREVSQKISEEKGRRYSAEDIRDFNTRPHDSGSRECRICHRSDYLTKDNLCEICAGLIQLSGGILEKDFFVIEDAGCGRVGIPIWKDRIMIPMAEGDVRKIIREDPHYVRSYSKNRSYTGEDVSTKLWVGNYSSCSTLGELAESGEGIERLGVLRADVDNLGQTFVAGFPPKYQTLSRTATFSRKMSQFFKLYLNDILQKGEFSLDGGDTARKATVIYSGGDDVFIVGAWKDILEFAVDLEENLRQYTQGALTISAGFGLFKKKYPISYIAEETGRLEDRSKLEDGKNAITLFDETPISRTDKDLKTTYHWDEFKNKVIEEKFRTIDNYFKYSQEHGKAFLYKILELFRNREDKINLARLAYLFARMEPGKTAAQEEKNAYQVFREKLYDWINNSADSAQVITAIYLYIYLTREEKDDE